MGISEEMKVATIRIAIGHTNNASKTYSLLFEKQKTFLDGTGEVYPTEYRNGATMPLTTDLSMAATKAPI